MVVINIWLIVILAITFLMAIGAWYNTRIIIKDLAVLKAQMGIKDEKPPSVFDNDLDKE
ncbi:hypothetical protein [Mesobacillus selenatarsenatis]|uniref:Uncharacterized protein n=1 Tax=Mesobacillus selenatarsenatis (strain DSM 18680 / JCM 14380 / FERM P-15431 / SF-1) TaxID=1321606 RepID=A0A0A8X406_MESS1|nr:hypothetical protein [Mesobacillus selenatarsenatis]GAM14678.1 hypothetical protein SAMD00020551_2831 [Mesobacillus selenatarsenatis SF-1]